MKKFILSVLAAIAVILPTSVSAEVFWKENQWTIYDRSSEEGAYCELITSKNEIPASGEKWFIVHLSDHGAFVSVGDSRWKLPVDGIVENIVLSFLHDEVILPSVFRDRWLAVNKNNITYPVSEDILDHFSAAEELLIANTRNDGSLQNLMLIDLTGSSRALDNLKACKFYADMRRDLAGR